LLSGVEPINRGGCKRLSEVEAGHTNATNNHPVVDIEAIRRDKIVAPVDAGAKDGLDDGSPHR